MVSAKLYARMLSALVDLQNRVAQLEEMVLVEDEKKAIPHTTLYDHQTRIDEFVSED